MWGSACSEGIRGSRTVTLDRGMGFADFEKVVQATGAVFCFALPRHPWRRGGNGNTDGLIRVFMFNGFKTG